MAQAYEVLQRQSANPESATAQAGHGSGDPSELLFRAAGRAAPSAGSQLWEYTCACSLSTACVGMQLHFFLILTEYWRGWMVGVQDYDGRCDDVHATIGKR